MKKQYLFAFLFLTLAITAVSSVFGSDLRPGREQIRLDLEARWAEADARREALRAEIEAKRASSTAKRIEFQQDIARRKVAHVTRVMLATIERLEKILARIESRIDKVQARGGETTESKKVAAEAKVNLSAVRARSEEHTSELQSQSNLVFLL